MERYDNTAPVYLVTDHTLSHADYEASESDDTMSSETSSMRTMSTLQSDQVAGTFPIVSTTLVYPYQSAFRHVALTLF